MIFFVITNMLPHTQIQSIHSIKQVVEFRWWFTKIKKASWSWQNNHRQR